MMKVKATWEGRWGTTSWIEDYYGFEHRGEDEEGEERAFNHRSILTYR